MATIKISQLPPPPAGSGSGSPKGTDLVPATDVTDTTSSASGTTKKYTQSSILNFYLTAQGLTTYQAVRVATTSALNATYSNGSSGVGATLTNTGTQVALTIDGVALSLNDRVLVKNQGTEYENGIYFVSNVGSGSTNWVLTRATDYDAASEIVQYGVVLVNQGDTYTGLLFQETSPGPFVIGTSPITFVEYVVTSTTVNGTVNTGTANQLAWYAATGNAVSGLATANNGILVTSSLGVPSIGNAVGADLTINGLNLGQGPISSLGNTVFGMDALESVTTSNFCTAIGYQALRNSSTSTNHTAIGGNAMLAVTGGANSVAVGVNAMWQTTGAVQSTAVGVGAGGMSQSTNSIYIGHVAASSATTGGQNTIIGCLAASTFGTGAAITTGGNNTIIGCKASVNSATGDGCIALGVSAVATAATGVTSGDAGPGIAIGSSSFKVGFRGDGSIYPGNLWRVLVNGTAYMIPLAADGSTSLPIANGGTGVTSVPANGQLLIGNGTGYTVANITAGTGVSITNGAGSITIGVAAGGLSTATIAGTTQTAVVNTQYIALNAAQTTVTLPATFAVGDTIKLIGSTANVGGWVLTAQAGDTITVNNSITSSGGTVTCSAVAGQVIEVVCDVANTSWVMTSTVSVTLTTA